MTAQSVLARLLDDELAFSPSYRGYFSNHLAMELAALQRLGAPDGVLRSVFDAHARNGPEARTDGEVLAERLREVASDGIAATVRDRAPALVDAPGTALFHPIIRLAYGLDVAHEGQVAAALLDWETRRHALPVPEPSAGGRRLGDIAAVLSARPAGTWHETFDLDGTARRPELRESLRDVAFDRGTLDDVSSFAIAAHIAADHFITLHLVTGARAIRTVSEWVDDATAARLAAHALPVMAVAYAAAGAPRLPGRAELDALRRTSLPSREQIAERAIADLDAHVVKLADVALAEEERTGDPLYRVAAGRVVGLLDRPAAV
ncbi:questin oxidase family protein [Desertimonas flava]|uniref:questin oxidase family protein n=1 Tax=Desertimonas flava TaxID=2064846 RepID=UPI000E348B73|nr:questin oxidase family protein [Desertimonas flava]